MQGNDAQAWFAAIAMALSAVNTIWMWVKSGRMPTEEAIAKLDTCQDEHGRRIQSIESDLRHVPSKDDLAQVKLGVAQMLGRMDVISAELAGTSRSLRRMEDHIRGVGQ